MINKLKKYWKWVVGIIILIFLVLVLLHESMKQKFYDRLEFMMELSTYTEETFVPLDIETTNMIINSTKYKYLDTIVKVGLREMGLNDKIAVSIRPITQEVKQRFDGEMTLEAHILGKGNQYMLFIDDMGRQNAIRVISHELVHLRQYRSGKFVMGEDYVIWDGKRYNEYQIYQMEYDDRPWEREAYTEQRYLRKQISDILYGK